MIYVDNAIIMAAGMATRLAPLSYEKPKALLNIKGEILIERQIRQIKEAGIQDITIVVGYLKEQFEYLRHKFGVQLVENPVYRERNNHSSLYVVRERLKNTYVSCADLYFSNNPFHKYVDQPYYAAVYKKGDTNEWCIHTDKSGKIMSVEIGGRNAWVMQGEALFDDIFSKKLIPLLEQAFNSSQDAGRYWEDLYVAHVDEMALYKKQTAQEDVVEFDSFEELRELVPEYCNSSGCKIIQDISSKLNCCEKDLGQFMPIICRNEVEGVKFSYLDNRYSYNYMTKEIKKDKVEKDARKK